MQRLLTIKEAARVLGVPEGSLRRVATDFGFLVRMGRATRIEHESLKILVERCREKPLEPAYGGEPTNKFGSSATPGALTNQPVQETVAMLKKSSRRT